MENQQWRQRFEKRFLELKRERKITQQLLADQLGKTQATIHYWLKGPYEPATIREYSQLAEALGISTSYLIFGVEVAGQYTQELIKKIDSLNGDDHRLIMAMINRLSMANDC